MFITIEGIEGSGKTSNANIIVETLNNLGIATLHTREPGGTLISESIRSILLNKNPNEILTDETELLLLFAARSQHIKHVIIPALSAGQYVICERFTDASFAYQGGGRKIDFKYIQFLADFVQHGLNPDLVILFDVDVNIAMDRIRIRKNLDRIEQETIEFFERVRTVYLARAAEDPKKYYIINANLSLAIVKQQLEKLLSTICKNR